MYGCVGVDTNIIIVIVIVLVWTGLNVPPGGNLKRQWNKFPCGNFLKVSSLERKKNKLVCKAKEYKTFIHKDEITNKCTCYSFCSVV